MDWLGGVGSRVSVCVGGGYRVTAVLDGGEAVGGCAGWGVFWCVGECVGVCVCGGGGGGGGGQLRGRGS